MKSARILVVDDEEIVLKSCLRILDGSDFKVETATNGRDALRRVEEHHYDLIVLDIMMPEMDGLELLQRLK
mgnify:FL=1